VRLPRNQVLIGDARYELAGLPTASVDMVLTSPPYFRLRDYQVSGQLGLEHSVSDWVDNLRVIAQEVARVLTPTGSFWLNVGDSYSLHVRQGAKRKSLLLGPERLALALIADGWRVRNKIVWQKANPMPSSVRDRLSCTWEALYVLVREQHYFFDLDAIRVPHESPPPKPRRGGIHPMNREAWRGPNGDDASGLSVMKARGLVGHPLGKNPGDVWKLASSNYRGAHHATFPISLARRAIAAGCPEMRCTVCRQPWVRPVIRALGKAAVRGVLRPSCSCWAPAEPGLVLDPFMGAGSTALAAEALRRDWLGIELNPDFAGLAEKRIREAHNMDKKRSKS
jgi:site-specific DNA-methyltransferase (adenine-specific)